jgi:uncharacterized protein YgfB (UPF0149 family)
MTSASYAEIERALQEARAMTDAAEAHGTLAGSLCAAPAYRFEDWLKEILPEGQAQTDASGPLEELFAETNAALVSDEMQFEPLLPADERPLDSRAAALAQWCQGFLYGLGSSRIHDASRLPGDVGEIVRDLTEITHAGAAATETPESDESAYAELVEFVRVGVQLIFEELEPFRVQPDRDAVEPLH